MIFAQIPLEDAMLGQFFGFEGRIGRGTWWLGQLLIVLILCVGIAILGLSMRAKDHSASGTSMIPLVLLYLLCVVINVSTGVKRYHDRGKSGWWFFMVFLPLIGGIWQLIELGFCSGTDGDNDYGPPPGSAARRAGLDNEIAGMAAGSGAMAKLDDNYMAEYARKIALQRAEAQNRDTSSASGFGGQARPVFGKR